MPSGSHFIQVWTYVDKFPDQQVLQLIFVASTFSSMLQNKSELISNESKKNVRNTATMLYAVMLFNTISNF